MRNRVVLIICILATGTLVSFHGGRISYALFYVTLFLPLSSLLYMLYVYLRFRIYQTIESKTVVKGEFVSYDFTLSNEDFITYTNVKTSFFEGKSTVKNLEFAKDYCLLPGESTNQSTSLCCHYRGEYEVGVESVTITDYLRLFSIRYRSPSHIRMRVYPKVIPLNKPVFALPKEEEMRTSHILRRTDGWLDSEARDYEFGDPLKTVHWKASARLGKVMTRKVAPFLISEALFFIDVSRPDYDALTRLKVEDKLLECALAVVHYFFRAGTAVKLFMDSPINGTSVTNPDSFQTFYHYCKDMNFKEGCTIGRLLAYYVPRIPPNRRILCITHQVDEELQYACHKAVSNGVDVALIYIGRDFDSIIHKLDGRILWIPIHWDQDIGEVLES